MRGSSAATIACRPPTSRKSSTARVKVWAKGDAPKDLAPVDAARKPGSKPRDVFVYFIHEGKLRAPAAAMALIERLG